MRNAAQQKPTIGKCLVWLPALIATLILAGCHPAEKAATPPTPANDQTAPPSPSDAGAASAKAAATPAPGVAARAENNIRESVAGEVNPFLTRQLHVFIQEKGRLPQNFNEFANIKLDSVPRPPAGKHWAIDGSRSEVKAVDAQ